MIQRRRIAVVLVLTLFTVPGAEMWTPPLPLWRAQPSLPGTGATATASEASRLTGVIGTEGTDILGNEVNSAVASYTLDPTGIQYEEHSPETELPRLGSPIS